ncbi:amino acid adenylation domain-containing protein [Streptomyces sp. NPDC047821]|uniref:non-ribosomal peptide synthetase n=1 Tax=Streptomyces sp. NPDC047821 TaxID=3365488 RepID=UPI003721B0DA
MADVTSRTTDDLLRTLQELSPERRALLARRLAARTASAAAPPPAPALPRGGGTEHFVPSPGQQQLHYQYELDPGALNYLLPIAVRLHGDLDPDALAAALTSVVARHESLRTGFAPDPGRGITQVVRAAHEVSVELARGTAHADDVPRLIEDVTTVPFDLTEPPLLRAALWELQEASPGGAERGGAEPGERSWLLVLCVHHIVVDGWSLGVLVDEIAEAYAAAVGGRPADLPDLPVQYAEFADRQQTWLSGPDAARQLAHWRERLDGAPPLELPGDRPRPAKPTYEGAAVRLDLEPALVEGIGRLGRSENATPFMVLLAAYAAVLHRWSAERDLVVGTAVAGRSGPEWEPLIGFFVNTLPLRLAVDPTGSFRDLLRTARDSALDGFAHQDVPYPVIVREAGGERRSGRSALLRVLLALRNVPARELRLPGVRTETLELPKRGSDLDLSLEFAPSAGQDGGLTGWLSYAADLFDPGTARRIATALHEVLAAAVATDGAAAVCDLPMTTAGEHHRLVAEWSGRGVPGAADGDLLDAFHARAAATPGAVAAVADTAAPASLTYRELDERANRLAHLLLRRGVRPEDRVAVLLPRGLPLLTAVLAVLKAGAVLLPLESEHPSDRLARIVTDASPVLALTNGALAARLPDGVDTLRAEDLDALTADCPAARPAVPHHPDGGAYVLYTSGSTGRPKGVVVTRGGLAERLAGMCAEFSLRADEAVLHKTPLSADTCMWELLVALHCGGTVVLAEPGRHTDADYLYGVLTRHAVTTCFFVPSVLRPALERGGFAAAAPALRLVIAAGEELPAGLADQLLAQAPHIRLVNSYGPTETTINIAEHTVTAPASEPVPIGRPVPGTELYVLGEHGGVQPVGVPGELHAGGAQVARGYLGRPGQTADVYVPHPFVPGARLYRTGDRARWRPDGLLEFLGRTDHQVKIRGFRVEPAEVESALRTHPDVADAVVLARKGPSGAPRLVGYATPAPGRPAPDTAALRAHLRGVLPSPMVPDLFVVLDAFPVTLYGKIDRAALPEPGPVAAAVRRPPADALQEVLAGIWRETLKVDDPGIDDDFFELGGHSVLATLVVSRIRELFRLELPLHFFVDAPTIASLATLMRAEGAEAGTDVDRVAALVRQVQRMTPDEVARKLGT